MTDVNDAVRFLLEMCALAAVGYWGWRTFAAATATLVAIGKTSWAVLFAVVAAVNEILNYPLS